MKECSRLEDRGYCKFGCSRTVKVCHFWAKYKNCRHGRACRRSHQSPEARRTSAASSSHQRPEAHAPVPKKMPAHARDEEKKIQPEKGDHSMISTNQVQTCPICLELATRDSGSFVSLQCGHTFHADCIMPVMHMPASQPKCPLCHQKISATEIRPIIFS